MLCVKPITVESKGSAVFPCGRCKNCRINQKRAWQSRILLEAATAKFSAFVTLTYREPPGGGPPHVLQKRHLQLFFKRLRYEGFELSYLGVGEYGERTKRAHYHVLLFADRPVGSDAITRCWGRGSVDVGDVEPASIDYCLAYVLKGRKGLYRDDGRPAEFRVFSQGLGRSAVIELIRAAKGAGLESVPREFRTFGKFWSLTRRHREIVEEQGWSVAPLSNEETAHEMEKALLVLQGVSWNSPEYLAWLEKRQEILRRARSRRIRDYYLAKNGHLKGRNETI